MRSRRWFGATSSPAAQAELFRIEGGNGRLVDALIRATPARVLLGSIIRAVAHTVDRITISVTDASGLMQQIEGDYLVMTLPASTLREVEIRPPLPEDQYHAIAKLLYGRATKVLVQSSTNLFESRHARAFGTDGRLGAFWDSSEEQGTAVSIVAFLAGGSASASLRALAATGGRELLSELGWLGMNRAAVTAVRIGDWTTDPWARGGYAFLDPAFDPAWRPLLSRRAGRIVFAGEHTSERWQGYMNGAVESGQRAARELLEGLR